MSLLLELSGSEAELEELVAIHEELDKIGSALDDVISASASESITLEEDSSKISSRELEELAALDDVIPACEPESKAFVVDSVEQAKNTVATTAYKKYLKALDAIGRI